MNDYKLSTKTMVMTSGSSKGTQPKFYENGFWYKRNVNGYEGDAEYLCSLVLEYSNATNFVSYERCTINGANGCRSKSFINAGEMFYSFERLHNMSRGNNLEETIREFPTCISRIQYVKDFLSEDYGYDCSEYLSQILSLDALTLNCDRHFNNLGAIINIDTGVCSPAPIFDNGDSLLSNFHKFNSEILYENIERVYARPFSADHIRQALDAGIGLKLNYAGLEERLSLEPDRRPITVLKLQMEKMRNIIPEITKQELEETF